MMDAPTTDEPDRDPSHKPTTLPPTNDLYIMDFLLANLYTNNTGRLPRTYIIAMLPSKPFKPSSPTSLPSLTVYLLPSPVTFGTCSFHKLS
jgi:hypothetical protein